MVARAINSGQAFGRDYAQSGPVLKSYHRRVLLQTLERLESGEVFEAQDDECISAMGSALVSAANDLRPGYGNRILDVCKHEEYLFNNALEDLRRFILQWESFDFVRKQARARIAARRLLSQVEP
ncbi:hypothetical protein [Falsihalocynthiibacter arcticus]|uniref:Uncharacterized protein n=1 Tax=Falsihalocynthiibacter arcticus TaxID=1579316 RepID=A0A126V3D7_9RHOB|nr:hypothetical protein [Falsihalocynthiibacter arcticus]AML52803.1 hypothetical protein RC74_17450 [Falsihalocynthiibacter arcticus]